MTTLELDYDNLRAILSIDDINSDEWAMIKTIVQSATEEYSLEDYNTLSLPWWAFLALRERLGLIVIQYNILFHASKNALVEIRKHAQTSFDKTESIEISPTDIMKKLHELGFIRTLFDYQLKNVSKMIRKSSAATFSVPGAGKTTEALAFYCLKATKDTKLIIVCPKNAFAVWEDEINICMPAMKLNVIRLRGGVDNIQDLLNQTPDVALTTYAQFQVDEFLTIIAEYFRNNPTMMFLDESHHMKRGLTGVRGQGILSICHLPRNKIIMSGTPMPNSIKDLIPQFNFLFPEIVIHEHNILEQIQSIYVRTTKDDLQIPKMTFHKIIIPMASSQARLYSILKNEHLLQSEKYLKAEQRIRLRYFGKSIMKLLQLVSNPPLVIDDIYMHHPSLIEEIIEEGESNKLKWACNRARQLANENKKVIIWTSFVKNVEIIASRLIDLNAVFIHGGVDAGSDIEEDTREGRIKIFKTDTSCKVLVANPAAAGEGISLHKECQNSIYIDRTYNASHYMQSMDRIHRIGLKPNQNPTIEYLISKNTIDESVDARLNYKIKCMYDALNDKSLSIMPYVYELDEESIDDGDILSYLKHLKGGGS